MGPLILFVCIIFYVGLDSIKNYCFPESVAEYNHKADLEGLVDYWEALETSSDRPVLIGREIFYTSKYACQTFTDESFKKLQDAEVAHVEKIIQGVPSYHILDNIAYR